MTFEEFCEKYLDMNDAWSDLRTCYNVYVEQRDKICNLQTKLNKAIECIEFYAEERVVLPPSDSERFDYDSYYPDKAHYKIGKRARQTLEEIK